MAHLQCSVPAAFQFDLRPLPPGKQKLDLDLSFTVRCCKKQHIGVKIKSIKEKFETLYNKSSSKTQQFKTMFPWDGVYGEDVLQIEIIDGIAFNANKKPKPSHFEGKKNVFLVKLIFNQVPVITSNAAKIERAALSSFDAFVRETEEMMAESYRKLAEKARAELMSVLEKTLPADDPVDKIDLGEPKGSYEDTSSNQSESEKRRSIEADLTLSGDVLDSYDN